MTVTFLSGAESAFNALARGLPPKYALRATIDTDLTTGPGEAPDTRSALDAISLVDRAIGVLVERGLQPDEAATRLQDQATAAAVPVDEAARTVLASIPRPTTGRGPSNPIGIAPEPPEH
ncbi:ANTAR domain-containing protein [Parafrankia sp. FMc6]|uniref:ANTAR domain-containing protein n=1 Tax=Parafrankia soli TaxID=2599596 RepID=UPI0034D56C47